MKNNTHLTDCRIRKPTQRRLAVQYFLRNLLERMERDKVNCIHPFFLSIYSKQDLKEILLWMYGTEGVPLGIDPDLMDKEALLETIGDDYYLLSYELQTAANELAAAVKPTQAALCKIVKQLGLEGHYLMDKLISDWDDYDYSNYRALSFKAGNPVPVYGIFDRDVPEENKYLVTTPPSRLYNTEKEAAEALQALIQKGTLKAGEAKVLML
jgi:hypothetical protein